MIQVGTGAALSRSLSRRFGKPLAVFIRLRV